MARSVYMPHDVHGPCCLPEVIRSRRSIVYARGEPERHACIRAIEIDRSELQFGLFDQRFDVRFLRHIAAERGTGDCLRYTLRALEVAVSNDDCFRAGLMQCLAECAANSARASRYDDDFVSDLHGSSWTRPSDCRGGETRTPRPRIFLDRARLTGSPNNFKRLVNFLNLRKNANIPLAHLGETDEIPVKLTLEVGSSQLSPA